MLRTRPLPLLLLVATTLGAAACGGDPAAPRDVRPVDAVPAPANVTHERDDDSPSAGLPCSAQPDVEIGLCGAATDNYKAAYNEDPDAPERRTWLALHELELDGERWHPVPDTPLTAEQVRLRRVDDPAGTARTATVEVVSGPGESVQLRAGPQRGLWGVLLRVESADALRDEDVVVRMRVGDAAGDASSVEIAYRHDPALADVPSSSLEHAGPAGRWIVAGIATATNLELGWE